MLRALRSRIAPADAGWSFSQCGEDRIAKWVLDVLGIARPRYLDVGTHHPRRGNNTFLLHALGGSGVLVEPNPAFAALIRKERPRDVCLAAGVAGEARRSVPFYRMRSDTLCTFSKREAERMVTECGEEILDVIELPVVTPSSIQSEHFRDGLDFVSLDVEGLELEILRALDLETCRPAVLCVETLTYAIDGTGEKRPELIALLASRGYPVYADTHINTLLVDEERARSLRRPRSTTGTVPGEQSP